MKQAVLRKPVIANPLVVPQVHNAAIPAIQKQIETGFHLPGIHKCNCQACQSSKFILTSKSGLIFHSNFKETANWLRKILQGLTVKGAASLKLYVPDILFVQGDALVIFQTNRHDNRIVKVAGNTPIKLLLSTFIRMRQNYKSIVEQVVKDQNLLKMNPEHVTTKYFEKFVPSHFKDGLSHSYLQNNKNSFKRYVLHKTDNSKSKNLDEPKASDKQPYCIVKYSDGNCQLFNQLQFQVYAVSHQGKLHENVKYIQSFVKYQSDQKSILYSQYTLSPTTIDVKLDQQVQQQVMILLGGIDCYDDSFKDIDTMEEISSDLMISNSQKYVQRMTYKIVHYLAMASNIFVNHIKIKWILADFGTIYLQEIVELQTSTHSKRLIKYHLPVLSSSNDIYGSSNQFLQIYKNSKKKKSINTLIIKKDLDQKTFDQLSELVDSHTKKKSTIDHINPHSYRQFLPLVNRRKNEKLEKSLDSTPTRRSSIQTLNKLDIYHRYKGPSTYEQHLKAHPELVMKHRKYNSVSLNQERTLPASARKINKNIDHHFMFNMSSQDHSTFANPLIEKNKLATQRNSLSGIQSYFQKEQARVSQSLLYTTFCRQAIVGANLTIQSNKIGSKMSQKSNTYRQ